MTFDYRSQQEEMISDHKDATLFKSKFIYYDQIYKQYIYFVMWQTQVPSLAFPEKASLFPSQS